MRWKLEQEIAERRMARVRVWTESGIAELGGTLSVQSEHGREYGPFRIAIRYPSTFPRPGENPEVYLRSHRDRWQYERDSHIERDWRLCFFVAIEAGIDFTRENSLDQLIDVTTLFLFKEHVYQRDLFRHLRWGAPPPVWPGADRSHGVFGIREAVADAGRMPSRNDPCPCGSGRRFRRCHGPMMRL